MEALGPVTAAGLAAALGVESSEVEQALLRLEGEGSIMRGSFTPDAVGTEWCERRLLARIHRYTVDRLRKEIEPVTTQDFMRFLCERHHVTASERKEGPDALAGILADLEGFEAPAAAWETEILPARVNHYDFAWLDDLCLSGRAVWTRLAKPRAAEDEVRRAGPVRTTPIAILARRNAAIWNTGCRCRAVLRRPRRARALRKCATTSSSTAPRSSTRWSDGTRLLGTELEEALAELVALGLIVSDSFAGLRALLVPMDRRKSLSGEKRRGPHCRVRHSRRGPLVARARPVGRRRRRDRARRAHAAAPLRRRVLAPARARSRLAAAVAGYPARAAPARSARRNPRRPFRRGHQRRAVRAA
jgi:ATP-dependent Lhr-like helicase